MSINGGNMKKEDSVVYNEKPKRTNKWVMVLIVVVATLFTVLPFGLVIYSFFAFENSVYTEFEEKENGDISIKKDIKVYDVEGFYNEEEKSYYVQGYLENKSKSDLEFINIEYSVYDKEDTLLGTAYASIDSLKANTKWKFKAIYSDIDSSEISRFELSEVEFY